MDKKKIAEVFEEIATLLELKADNPFKIRAYRNAAHTLLNLEEDLSDLIKDEKLTELEGIGDDLAEKITTLAKTGHLAMFDKLKRSVPSGLLELMKVHGLGGKKVTLLYDKLHIKSIGALKEACLKGKLSKLKGFGPKTEKNILDALEHRETYSKRTYWWKAWNVAQPILEGLQKLKSVKKAAIAGSLRRRLETVGDLDFLVATSDPKPVMKWFTSQPFVDRVIARGDTKSSVRLKDGIQADLRIVTEKQYGFALLYFTGSKDHNIKLRELALKRKLSLSEYGFEPAKRNLLTEKDIYKFLGFSYIPPELRENLGELEAARKGKIPVLVEEKDIRGTFHNHTTASDGRSTLTEMVSFAQKLKWDYIGISDHSKSSFQAKGLKEPQLVAQIEQIRKLNASKKFRPYVFAGVECDILPNGSLDVSDKTLKLLDYVVISIHSAFSQDEKTMTKRLIRAIEHPLTTMVGHVTGRLLLKRQPYKINLSKVIDACIANKKIIEINSQPQRLDMDWRLWHAASEKGLMCCINTDAHEAGQLEFFRTGVGIARKGWLEKEDVINTRPLKAMQKLLQQMKKSAK